jgi:hypothetical protein
MKHFLQSIKIKNNNCNLYNMAKNWNQTFIFILLLSIYVIARLIHLSRHYKRLKEKQVETFTPKINGMYRPYVRHINNKYESFMNNYGHDIIINKLKKWGIY